MASVVKVEEIGSLWVSTAEAVKKAQEDAKIENEKRRKRNNLINQNLMNDKLDYEEKESTLDNMKEITDILNKSGLKKFFPFEPTLNENKEIVGFKPKGKNDKEVKENIAEYKAKMQEALEKGKITEEEFEKLDENLDELMKENDIELEENKELEVSDQEIMDNIKQFIMHNYGEKDEFAKECENYEKMELDERKFKLQDINSKVNTQLGIAGELHFSKNPNLKFGNSFFNKDPGGYYLTEEEVMKKGLSNALYTMMEKSLMRQKEQQMGQQISPYEKEKMHKKIMEERKQRIEQKQREQEKIDRKNAQVARQRMRNWNG